MAAITIDSGSVPGFIASRYLRQRVKHGHVWHVLTARVTTAR